MSTTVTLLPKEMSLPGAAHRLAEAGVSDAPVVDEQGRCIGVLSNTDFVRYADKVKTHKQPCPDQVVSVIHQWHQLAYYLP